ncbi:VOC family protein [Salinigranum sp. GCM10025319]|uniref:VOC family protein n=1 Tax=Salinigranum sp. GCM10025319 TaxID=3252687 RepID=UPI003610C0CC
MTQTLHQVYLMVTDIERSIAFYEDALGFTLAERSERKATFETGRCSLVLQADFDEPTLAAFGLEPPGERRGDGLIVVVDADDVEAVHDRAKDAGASIPSPPRTVDWGREMMLVEDPDGYVLEISRPLD